MLTRRRAATIVEYGSAVRARYLLRRLAVVVGAPSRIGAAASGRAIPTGALQSLAPAGTSATGGKQLFAVGRVAVPSGLRTTRVAGKDPATLAAKVARLRATLSGAKPAHIIV